MQMGREAAAPGTISFRRFDDGFEIALLQLSRLRSSRKELVGVVFGAFLVVFFMVLMSFLILFLMDWPLAPGGFFAGLGLVIGALMIAAQFRWKRPAAVLEARGGLLTLVQTGEPSRQWNLAQVLWTRVLPHEYEENRWELELCQRDQTRTRVLGGRLREELEWVRGLLRAALAPPRQPVAAVVWVSGGECQVCSTPMETQVVLCARCRTPHHEECWTWNGSCSTYACREIRFTRPA